MATESTRFISVLRNEPSYLTQFVKYMQPELTPDHADLAAAVLLVAIVVSLASLIIYWPRVCFVVLLCL